MCLMSWAEKLNTSAMRVVVMWSTSSYAERNERLLGLGLTTDVSHTYSSFAWDDLPGSIRVGLYDVFYGRKSVVQAIVAPLKGRRLDA